MPEESTEVTCGVFEGSIHDDIKHLQLRSISGEDEVHRLTMVLRDGKKHEIENGGDLTEVVALADDVADAVNVEVVRK